MEYYLVIKKGKHEIFIGNWMQLEATITRHINQTHMYKHCIVSLVYEIKRINKRPKCKKIF